MKKVMITMKSIQIADNDRSESELVTEGTYYVTEDGTHKICYDESEATGYEGSTTVLTCIGNKYASMERRGTAPALLIIEKDKKHHCHYGTPFGEFMVGVYAHKIDNRLDEQGGDLYFRYTLDVNSTFISDNEIYIKVH
ncbi:MAG: DUF1934 domain-containing protein [Oscillospiraceae bacterium]|nr:DUF1934 domain-containing protein [Oscillospiraceae bacterium]